MSERRVTRLEELPAFTVLRITIATEPELLGVFSHLRGVGPLPARSWLYAGIDESLNGDLVKVNAATLEATFIAPFWTTSSPIQVGSVVPWLQGCWHAYHIPMILHPAANWKRTAFRPSPAQHFQQGEAHGWTKAGQPLPAGAVVLHVDQAGWDHEHCELCQVNIGSGGAAHGYVDCHDHWLCERCYRDYAATRSLSFLLPD